MEPPSASQPAPAETSEQRCPTCGAPMRIRTIIPIMFAVGLEDITWRCEACDREVKRTVRTRRW